MIKLKSDKDILRYAYIILKMSKISDRSAMLLNYDYMMQSPIVLDLIKKNNRLLKQNKILTKALDALLNKSAEDLKPLSKVADDEVVFVREVRSEPKPIIKIKTEPKTELAIQLSENVIYELLEEEEAEEEEAEEEEAEEEEAEEEEAEEEEAEEEEAEEEEAEEEEAEEEEAEEEEAEEEEAEEEEAEEEEAETIQVDDEEEVYEIAIKGKKYFTTNEKNGSIYAIDKNGDVGNEIGSFKNGVACFA
jgi:cobalamin biosynthesis protein CobT